MGHLSNPIGFRLAFEKKWNFTFFVKNIYYPEVVNTLINLRDYIYYYLTRKKILQSGLCLSHFMLSKMFKQYYIKIFIYHIDLEKTSYDLINKFFHLYYETYNEMSHKYDKNKTANQVKLYHYLRDISNSDVFVYLFIYILFYKGTHKKNINYLNKHNVYAKNKKIKNYYKLVTYSFFKHLLYFYLLTKRSQKSYLYKKFLNKRLKKKVIFWIKKLNFINSLNKVWSTKKLAILEKNQKIAKIKGLILYKAKKLIKTKPLTYYMINKCNYFKQRILNFIQYRILRLAWAITKISIKKKIKKINKNKVNMYIIKETQLLQKALQKFNLKNFFWVGKYKFYRMLTLKKKIKKINKKILKLNNILYDNAWRPRFSILIENNLKRRSLEHNLQVDPFTLFFYLAKKIGFKKVKNSFTLWKKWSVILKYIQLFNLYNFLYKKLFFYNLHFFYFYIKTAIWHSVRMKKKGKIKYKKFRYFNLKTLIFSCLQQGIYITFFRPSLIWLNIFLKNSLLLIHNACSVNKLKFDNIILYYSFISNNNVTAAFLAYYIVLKLKRGFSVVKTLNPLKRELVRVSKRSRNAPYINYLTKYVKVQQKFQFKYKRIMASYIESCFTFYDYLSSLFYVNNSIKIKPNLFLYFFNFKEQIKKSELSFASTWRFNIIWLLKNIIYNNIKAILFKIKKNKMQCKQKKIIKKYIKICGLNKLYFFIQYKLYENITIRHGMWLFFLSIFRFYEKKGKKNKIKYKYYHKDLKQKILLNYKKYQKFNNILNIMNQVQMPKMNLNFLQIKVHFDIYNNNFLAIFNLCNKLILYKSKRKINNFRITFSSFFNRNYVNYSKLKALWNLFNKINIRNEKDLYIPKYKSLIMGFKMVLKGRFSRKQRASKVTLIKGKVPLNTFNMNIDYSFEHITLKNSEISLKFYLYKAFGFEIYKRNLKI